MPFSELVCQQVPSLCALLRCFVLFLDDEDAREKSKGKMIFRLTPNNVGGGILALRETLATFF